MCFRHDLSCPSTKSSQTFRSLFLVLSFFCICVVVCLFQCLYLVMSSSSATIYIARACYGPPPSPAPKSGHQPFSQGWFPEVPRPHSRLSSSAQSFCCRLSWVSLTDSWLICFVIQVSFIVQRVETLLLLLCRFLPCIALLFAIFSCLDLCCLVPSCLVLCRLVVVLVHVIILAHNLVLCHVSSSLALPCLVLSNLLFVGVFVFSL